MKRDDALKAINAYCDRDLSLDPAFNPGDQFFQEPPDGASWDLFMEGLDGYVIKMDAKFGDGGRRRDVSQANVSAPRARSVSGN
ncbi:uncharacterized protein RHO25_005642 [Cercospora beticola]|uniref:Uncharacterized protein n=1 Tax=Cercospora beticola TaxID=122368 RepID=A0ABZ0NNG1_CERBT|nr:hypothetical protein RHO25_005642 [Cercospora beticola]